MGLGSPQLKNLERDLKKDSRTMLEVCQHLNGPLDKLAWVKGPRNGMNTETARSCYLMKGDLTGSLVREITDA